MKKITALLLVVTLLAGVLAGCGKKNETAPETTAPEVVLPGSALEILENIWNLYGENEKFPVMGGNMESAVMDAPGNYDMTYAENLPFNLLIPADQIANVDQVASMIHAMNANTFTCGAFHLKGVDAAAFADTMQAAVQGNMWMCGFPERLIIASIGGEYVVVAFGVNDAMTPYAAHLAEAYPEAKTVYDEPIG